MKQILGSVLVLTTFFGVARAQSPAEPASNHDAMTVDQYIATYKHLAIAEMQRSGVPASITLAQGIIETEAGNSDLFKASDNHFGIKCKDSWTGPSVLHDDDAHGECFRKYDSDEASFRDHSDFLRSGSRYAFLFQLDPLDYKGWAWGLHKAGYATNPQYAQKIIHYIEQYHLQDYSLIAMGKMADPDSALAATTSGQAETTPTQGVADLRSGPAGPAANAAEQAPAVHYPEGVFKINESRVIFAAKGTSLLALANQYKVSLSYLVDFNDLGNSSDDLSRDQLIYLQRKRTVGGTAFHVMAGGETLYDVAQGEGIRLSSLMKYNQLGPGMEPAAGERLSLQSIAGSRPKLRSTQDLVSSQ